MGADVRQVPCILVWFEDSPDGRRALAHARELAQQRSAPLTVMTVATRERVIGCGRCLQGTVLWNLEMQKIAQEDLVHARRLLGDVPEVFYETVTGTPVEAIVGVARRIGAGTVVTPAIRESRFGPPSRRGIAEKVAQALGFTQSHAASPSPSVATAQRVT